tara:strand:- start:5966 stop:6469 length:504 start_codon:yes stop_codon:yes gene_type:complete
MTSKIDISISLEGEQAMKLLKALASITDATVAVEKVQAVMPEPETAPKKKSKAKPKRTSMGTMSWTEEQLDYLSKLLHDYHNETGKITFPAKSNEIADEFYALTGVKRTQKALNVRIAMRRGDNDKRFFPDGMQTNTTKGNVRPRGRPPKGKVWDADKGEYVPKTEA